MTHQQIRELYGESVYQIRLRVATSLLTKGHSQEQALIEADQFVALLQSENVQDIIDRFS